MDTQADIQNQLGQEDITLITERIDDVPLLIAQMVKMGYPDTLDTHTPKNWSRRTLSFGWTTTIWLAYILSEGDHRKVSVEAYVDETQQTLRQLTGQDIVPLDFSDDRLTHLLHLLKQGDIWQKIEHDLTHRSVEVYDLKDKTIRCDATTVSGYHQTSDTSAMQYGHSKDNPNLPQVKIMTASLDPMGMPLATDMVSGERADDSLYLPVIERVHSSLKQIGLLFVGDCKMSSLAIRRAIVQHHHFYLSPLALIGNTAKEMKGWINRGLEKKVNDELEEVSRENTKGETSLVAYGYEFERKLVLTDNEDTEVETERVLVIHSPNHAKRQRQGLEKRLANAQKKIEALTPARGRGKRQITEEDKLLSSIAKILKSHRVEGLLDIEYEREVEQQQKYVGRGRGSANRERQIVERIRYQIKAVIRNKEEIELKKQKLGWKAFVTNLGKENLSLSDAVLNYRNEYRVERIFNRLKSHLNIAPLFVKRDDQIEGMTHLLMLAVRVLSLVEFVVRRSLKAAKTKLSDLHPENKKKKTDNPTAERVLKTFSNITLTIIKNKIGDEIARFITPLSEVQRTILKSLSLKDDIYQQLKN